VLNLGRRHGANRSSCQKGAILSPRSWTNERVFQVQTPGPFEVEDFAKQRQTLGWDIRFLPPNALPGTFLEMNGQQCDVGRCNATDPTRLPERCGSDFGEFLAGFHPETSDMIVVEQIGYML